MYIIPKILRKIFGIPAIKGTKMERHTKIDSFSVVVNSSMGAYSYIGEHSSVLDTQIGKYCSISNYCAIGGGAHAINWVSTSPVFNSSTSILHYRFCNPVFHPFLPTVIGSDVWIGSHCLIKAGVTIGIGAVIGMGSVVTKNVGAYEIWGGNPAKLIRKRFDDETIERLLEAKWWEWPDEKVKQYAKNFVCPEKFLNCIEEVN